MRLVLSRARVTWYKFEILLCTISAYYRHQNNYDKIGRVHVELDLLQEGRFLHANI